MFECMAAEKAAEKAEEHLVRQKLEAQLHSAEDACSEWRQTCRELEEQLQVLHGIEIGSRCWGQIVALAGHEWCTLHQRLCSPFMVCRKHQVCYC